MWVSKLAVAITNALEKVLFCFLPVACLLVDEMGEIGVSKGVGTVRVVGGRVGMLGDEIDDSLVVGLGAGPVGTSDSGFLCILGDG